MASSAGRDTVTIGFSVYRIDYEFLHKLKQDGKVRHGELAKFMRLQLRQFLEAHAHNQPQVKQGRSHHRRLNNVPNGITAAPLVQQSTKKAVQTANVQQVKTIEGGLGVDIKPVVKPAKSLQGGDVP